MIPWNKTNDWRVMAMSVLRGGLIEDCPRDLPLYLCDASDLPVKFHSDNSKAYYSVGLDVRLSDNFPRCGLRWQQRGFCTVVQVAGYPQPDNFSRNCAIARTCVHEFCHHIGAVGSELADAPLEKWSMQAVAVMLQSESTWAAPSKANSTDDPPWAVDHGTRFVRAACHASWRIRKRTVFPVFAWQLCAGKTYGLSGGDKYASAMGDEPERMADLPIVEILATPAPDKFTRLFNRDTKRWLKRQKVAT